MKYGNQQYDGGSPLKVGDRYYAFDHVRDWWYQMDQIGHAVIESFGTEIDTKISGGVVSQGSTDDRVSITPAVAVCGFSVSVPDSAAVPPAVGTTVVAMVTRLDAVTDLLLSAATLDGVTVNYVKLAYAESGVWSRARAIAAGTYTFSVEASSVLTVSAAAPVAGEAVIGSVVGTGAAPLTITQVFPYRMSASGVQTITASATIGRGVRLVRVNNSSAITVTLDSSEAFVGQEVSVKSLTTEAYSVVSSTGTIDGFAVIDMTGIHNGLTVVFDGQNWSIA